MRSVSSPQFSAEKLNLSLNHFLYRNPNGRTFDAGDGQLMVQLSKLELEQTETNEWDWKGIISKLEAKKNQDASLVRNVKVACMQACPTNAISFGNVNDKESDVYKIRNVEQKHRSFYVMEQLHVLPNVSYLAKIKNTDREVTAVKEEEHQSETKQEEKAHA